MRGRQVLLEIKQATIIAIPASLISHRYGVRRHRFVLPALRQNEADD